MALSDKAKDASSFLRTDLWRTRLSDLPRFKAFRYKVLRIVILARHGLTQDQLLLRASSLTFYTLLSIVPVVAMAFGVAKGFGFEKMLERELFTKFPGQHDALVQVVDFAKQLLDNTRGGMIAGIGVAVLFWAVIKVLTQIEAAFNHIWKVDSARSWLRKFSDYLSIMLLAPLLVVLSNSLTVFIITQVEHITSEVALLDTFSVLIFSLLKIVPFLLIWLLFTLVYVIMPNTKVDIRSGLVGGIIAGTLYSAVQWFYIHFQVGIAHYNAIYGSFAALPLFLIWLQISWQVVLLGAEIASCHHSVEQRVWLPLYGKLSPARRRRLGLEAALMIVSGFVDGAPPMGAQILSRRLGTPLSLTREILDDLEASGLFRPTVERRNGPPSYLPTMDVRRYTVQRVIKALEHAGEANDADWMPSGNNALTASLDDFDRQLAASAANRPLEELAADRPASAADQAGAAVTAPTASQSAVHE